MNIANLINRFGKENLSFYFPARPSLLPRDRVSASQISDRERVMPAHIDEHPLPNREIKGNYKISLRVDIPGFQLGDFYVYDLQNLMVEHPELYGVQPPGIDREYKTVDWFLLDARRASRYVYENGLEMYVRKPIFLAQQYDLCIASVAVVDGELGKGRLTATLSRLEKNYRVQFEQVFNQRLVDFLLRRGYVLDGPNGTDYCRGYISPPVTGKPHSGNLEALVV